MNGDRAAGLRDRGWGPVAGDALEIIDVPGGHGELCREAGSAYVGPILARARSDG